MLIGMDPAILILTLDIDIIPFVGNIVIMIALFLSGVLLCGTIGGYTTILSGRYPPWGFLFVYGILFPATFAFTIAFTLIHATDFDNTFGLASIVLVYVAPLLLTYFTFCLSEEMLGMSGGD